MRLVAVEQLRKIENDALEVNIYIYRVYIYIASFSSCLHFTLVNFFFGHAWLIHVTFEQIQSRVYISPCRGDAFLE